MPTYPPKKNNPPRKPAWWNSILQSLSNIPVGGTPSPLQAAGMPTWLNGSLSNKINNKINQLGTPSGLGGNYPMFIPSGVTQYNQPATYPLTPTPSYTPPKTPVSGPPSGPYFPSSQGAGLIVGAGQTPLPWATIHGSDISTGPTTPDVPLSDYGGGGYGYGYKKRRRGGGRGYSRGAYQPTQYDNAPAWAKSAGLANWSIG